LNVNRRRGTSSLLFTTALLAGCVAGCSPGDAPKPDLPASVSPGWTLQKMEPSTPPANLPPSATPPVCWQADYSGPGEATVRICGYRVSASAFDAAQRMPNAASEVKFQRGLYLVTAHWNNVSQAGITALVGALERSLPDR
jgi:hypothetical protein